ncbi:MAG: hypothetical protein ACLP1D_12300 [Xanthobacteraceae bacterium]
MPMRLTLLCALLLALNSNAFAQGGADLNRLSCAGSVIHGNEGYQLEADAGSAPWCDSAIPPKLLPRVLRTCAVGNRCHIEGSVRGHGLFEWYRIRSITH